MLAGQRPFAAPTSLEVMLLQLQAPAPLLKTYCPDLDAELLAFIHRMLAKAPQDRPTMAAVAQQLGADLPDRVPEVQAAGGAPVPSTMDDVGPAPLGPVRKALRPRRALWALLGLGSLLPLTLGSVVFLRKLHGTAAGPPAIEARAPGPSVAVSPPRGSPSIDITQGAESQAMSPEPQVVTPEPHIALPEPKPVVPPQKAPQVRRPAIRPPVTPVPPVLFKNKDPDGF